MSINFDQFIGESYQSQDKYAAIERTSNWYLEPNESAAEKKYKVQLLPSPANAQFSTLPVPAPFNQRGRGIVEYRGQTFGISGTCCWVLDNGGNQLNLGTVTDDGKPVCWAPNANNQIFFSAGGDGYVIRVGPSPGFCTMVQVAAIQGSAPGTDFFGASYCTSQDGYCLVITPNSNQYQISGTDSFPTGNFELWSAANISIQEGQSDLLRTILSSREYVRLMGTRRSQALQNVGASGQGGFPFQSYNDTFIETGIAAPFSLADLGGPLFWIGEDARGERAAWLDPAFQPQRVSTFAVEWQWRRYQRIDDAVSFAFIWNGHLMVQITFPNANFNGPNGFVDSATWVYDFTASQVMRANVWHERTYTDCNGITRGRSEQFHCFAFGRHLVLSTGIDGNPGAIYQYADRNIQQDVDPQLLLRWSNDGGNTFSFEHQLSTGKAGEYSKRVLQNRCGMARDRVFWVRVSERGDCGVNVDGSQGLQAIVRDRICPHLWAGNKRVIYNRIEFEVSRALGSAGLPNERDPGLALIAAEIDLIACTT